MMANCPQLAGSRGKGDRFYAPSHSLRRSLAAACLRFSISLARIDFKYEINRKRVLREFVVEFSSDACCLFAQRRHR